MRKLGLLLSIFYLICGNSFIDATNRSRKVASPLTAAGEKRKKTKSTTNPSQRHTPSNHDDVIVVDTGTPEAGSGSSPVNYIGSRATTPNVSEEVGEYDDDLPLSELAKLIKLARRDQSRKRSRGSYFSPPAQSHHDDAIDLDDPIQEVLIRPYTYDPNRTPVKTALKMGEKPSLRSVKRVSFAPEAALEADQEDGATMNDNQGEIPLTDDEPLKGEEIPSETDQSRQDQETAFNMPMHMPVDETFMGDATANPPQLRLIVSLQIDSETPILSSLVEESASLESPLTPGTPEGLFDDDNDHEDEKDRDTSQEHLDDNSSASESLKLYALVSLIISITVSMVLLGSYYLLMQHRPIRISQ